MNIDAFKQQIIRHEGLVLKPYRDTVGKLTIGVGRNLEGKGISKAEALLLLEDDIADVTVSLVRAFPWWEKLDDVRQRVIADMCFNVGINGLLKFKKMLTAMEAGNYESAADEMKDSAWYMQVGVRAIELTAQMRTGNNLNQGERS